METLQKLSLNEQRFRSPTFGCLTLKQVFENVTEYVEQYPKKRYNLIIGSDSIQFNDNTIFVSAVVIHRVGHGGRYYYKKFCNRRIKSLRQRMFYEALLSVEVADILKVELSKNGLSKLHLEIHLDVGHNGDTKDIIKEVVGVVTGSGYPAVIKPDAYGAAKVADRHSK